MIEMFQSDAINWTWYCKADIEDGKATILLHDRLHYQRHAHMMPEAQGWFELVETEERIVTHLVVTRANGTTRYPVTNSKHIFYYPNFEHN